MFRDGAIVSLESHRFGFTEGVDFTRIGALLIAFDGYLANAGDDHGSAATLAQVAALYVRHGSALSRYLLGQYVGVIVDLVNKAVVLIQDSLGVRTLYWRQVGNSLVCGWTLASVCVGFVPITNASYFRFYLQHGIRPASITPFDGIFRLTGGESRVFLASGGVKSVYPWNPELQAVPTDPTHREEELRRLLDEAVSTALAGTARGLCELSGGLDSTSVVAAALRCRRDVATLSVTSGGGFASDDDRFIAIAVRDLNITEAYSLDQDDCPPFATLRSSPFLEPGGEMFTALRERRYALFREIGADRVLTGSGGDQIFGSIDVKPLHIADRLARADLLGAWRAAAEWRPNAPSQRSETFWLWTYGVRGALRQLRHESLIFGQRKPSPPWLRSINNRRDIERLPQIRARVQSASGQHGWEMIYRMADIESARPNFHPPAMFVHPLYHRPLVSFMLSLPQNERRGKDGSRVLQRRSLRDWLPAEIAERTSKGSNQELRERALLDNRAWTDLMLDDPIMCRLGWVQYEPWREAIEKARFGLVDNATEFAAAMCVEIWLRANAPCCSIDAVTTGDPR